MAVRANGIKLVHRIIGTKHVFTSPDVPKLHVSHADESIARADIQPSLDAIARVKERLVAKRDQARMTEVA